MGRHERQGRALDKAVDIILKEDVKFGERIGVSDAVLGQALDRITIKAKRGRRKRLKKEFDQRVSERNKEAARLRAKKQPAKSDSTRVDSTRTKKGKA